MKKGQVSIFILVGLFFVGAVVLIAWLKSNGQNIVDERECEIDSDCVPDRCCDAQLCVPMVYKPNCTTVNIFGYSTSVDCAIGCYSYVTGNLGCDGGRSGSCVCVSGKCAPKWN